MKKVNKLIYEDSPIDKFITSIYGTLDTEKHTFTYVNAGHNNPFIIRLEENKLEELKVGGVMLGIMDPVEFEEETAYLNPGDKLILFSDGITEAQNTKGEFFEDERFEEWLLTNKYKSPFNMMIDLLNDLVEFSNGEPQSDDITIIILEREK
jgi:sigma-B regulation protein RsbU (phosphoserine phosphatase)